MSEADCFGYTPTNANKIVVNEEAFDVSFDLQNWGKAEIKHFRADRGPCRQFQEVDQIVVHETDTMDWTRRRMENLEEDGLGYHFVINRQGTVYQHNDPIHRLGHAKPHNARSFAVALVNDVDPSPKDDQIASTLWNTEATVPEDEENALAYRLPTDAQLRALHQLSGLFIRGGGIGGVSVPAEWPGVREDYFIAFNLPELTTDGESRPPGILAHGHVTGKVCGLFPTLYLWHRFASNDGIGQDHGKAASHAAGKAGNGRFLPEGELPGIGVEGRPVIELTQD